MKEFSDQIKIVFDCNREGIPGTLNVCLTHIRNKAGSSRADDALLAKIKWVIMELLTNAVKHSGERQSVLKIGVSPKMVVLKKEDYGTPLMLVGQDKKKIMWPLEKLVRPMGFPIYHNGMDSLCVRTDESGKATFFIEALAEMEMPALLSDTSEHFGLLIMTKASDEFAYEHDPDTGLNSFICTFNLIE
ncbi:anti-sigma regulatory factor [Dyadobacter sp. CY261]|uniref:anti-sigma regulatory factor n=1 Tax=Dyadobacter sp. CY261 TaxID=2907203 RepID=UPI001F15CF79|nr:anti-sigma regulatory factor [Dyadobacter sp. CY261]MCF0068943.1 anti-sigma regulatory factor [Dyadobacter sp. CY261]